MKKAKWDKQEGQKNSRIKTHTHSADNPQTRGWSQLQKFSQRSKRYKPHTELPSSAVLLQEDDPPESMALKASGDYFRES